MHYTYRTVLLKNTDKSRERKGTDEIVITKRLSYDLNSVKTHSIHISVGTILSRQLLCLLTGAGCGIFLVLLLGFIWLATGGGLIDGSVALTIVLLTATVGAVVAMWDHASIPHDAAVELRAKENGISGRVRHWKIKAVPESGWESWIRSLDGGVAVETESIILNEKKSCGYCKKEVHAASKVGECCPHCGFKWMRKDITVI